MLDRAHEHINPLQVGPGDFVYLSTFILRLHGRGKSCETSTQVHL